MELHSCSRRCSTFEARSTREEEKESTRDPGAKKASIAKFCKGYTHQHVFGCEVGVLPAVPPEDVKRVHQSFALKHHTIASNRRGGVGTWRGSMRAASRELAVAIAILLSANASGNSTKALHNSYGGHRRLAARPQAECGVAGDCATLDTCNDDDYAGNCYAPAQYVCEHQLPGLNVCESPPLETMLPCWMSSLDDGLSLSEISIPGTHDTMAKGSSSCLQSGSGTYIHTQTWSLRTMLDAGVRALDIRLRHVDDSFTLKHGIVELPYAFDEDVRDVLQAFVSENPTEPVLMFYQINDLGPSTRTPEESLQESLDAYPDLWIAGSTIPTLGKARGKVALANDMAREEQNEYDLATLGEVSGKKGMVRDFFLESDSAPAAWGAFRLNYFSGTGASVYPLTVAAGVRAVFQGTNEVLFEFSDGCLGVTMFDFIEEDAIAHVVAQQGITAPAWNPPES